MSMLTTAACADDAAISATSSVFKTRSDSRLDQPSVHGWTPNACESSPHGYNDGPFTVDFRHFV